MDKRLNTVGLNKKRLNKQYPELEWCLFYSISFCNLGYINQTKSRLKARLDEHSRKVKNEEI